MDHDAWILPFLSKAARARFSNLHPGSKPRTKLLNRLCHDYETILDWRIAAPLPAVEQSTELVLARLRKLGAGPTCYVLCTTEAWDGRLMPLSEALDALWGRGLPVLLICVPGQLACFEPEYTTGAAQRFLLQRGSEGVGGRDPVL